MSMQLTDADRAAINCRLDAAAAGDSDVWGAEPLYLAGMRAGIERAAEAAATVRGLPSNPTTVQAMCITAIRELLT